MTWLEVISWLALGFAIGRQHTLWKHNLKPHA